jgi:hypothetical protein
MSNISETEKEVAVKERRSAARKRRSHENPADRPIWEVIGEIMGNVPEAVLNRLPADGAERHDHYLHGTHEKAPRQS